MARWARTGFQRMQARFLAQAFGIRSVGPALFLYLVQGRRALG